MYDIHTEVVYGTDFATLKHERIKSTNLVSLLLKLCLQFYQALLENKRRYRNHEFLFNHISIYQHIDYTIRGH